MPMSWRASSASVRSVALGNTELCTERLANMGYFIGFYSTQRYRTSRMGVSGDDAKRE